MSSTGRQRAVTVDVVVVVVKWSVNHVHAIEGIAQQRDHFLINPGENEFPESDAYDERKLWGRNGFLLV